MKTLYMTNSNFFIKSLAISAITFIVFLTSCKKDEDTNLFKDCVLPWTELEPIPQADLPKEIVDFTFKTFPELDTIYATVINFCNNKRLYIQTDGTINYDFLLYDNCGDLLAKGKTEKDSNIRSVLSKSIKQELGNEASLYDSFIVNYENGNIEYISEVYFLGDSPRYLFDKDGKVLCKLF